MRHALIKESLASHPIKTISIPSWSIDDQSHIVYYEIDIRNKTHRWNVFKRFDEFVKLHEAVCAVAIMHPAPSESTPSSSHVDLLDVIPMFPPKQSKLFVNHQDPQFLHQRRVLLAFYLQRIVTLVDLHEVIYPFLIPEEDEPDEEDSSSSSIDSSQTSSSSSSASSLSPSSSSSTSTSEPEMEDYDITDVIIPSAQILRDAVIFQIHLTNAKKRSSFMHWTCLKRFSDFVSFDSQLRSMLKLTHPHILPTLPLLPPKHFKFWMDHFSKAFVDHRRVLLEDYLRQLIHIPSAVKCSVLQEFLGV